MDWKDKRNVAADRFLCWCPAATPEPFCPPPHPATPTRAMATPTPATFTKGRGHCPRRGRATAHEGWDCCPRRGRGHRPQMGVPTIHEGAGPPRGATPPAATPEPEQTLLPSWAVADIKKPQCQMSAEPPRSLEAAPMSSADTPSPLWRTRSLERGWMCRGEGGLHQNRSDGAETLELGTRVRPPLGRAPEAFLVPVPD